MVTYEPKNIYHVPEYRYGKKPLDYYYRIHAKRTPNKTCVQYYGKEYTWSNMDDYINSMAKGLETLGVKKGDTVILFMQNCPQFLISFYAVQRLGGTVVPCSPMFKEWDIEYEANEIKAEVIIANSYLYPIVENVINSNNTPLKHVIVSSFKEFLPEVVAIDFDLPDKGVSECSKAISMTEILNQNKSVIMPEIEINMEHDIGLIMFTSGSTGLPKGAMLPYISGLYKGSGTANNFAMTECTNFLGTQPMNHIAGMCFMHAHAYVGCGMVLLSKGTAEAIMEAIDLYHCDSWYGSALMVDGLINHPDVTKYNLCHVRVGSATSFGIQLTKELADKWLELTKGGIMVETAYGLSETHTMDTVSPLERPVYGTCGIPIYNDGGAKIVDDGGNECPANVEGEIIVKNPAIFKGYYNNPEATAKTLKNGYVYTGDIGKKDDDGYLYFLGRKKEMIKTSGFSVFPEEIETYLCRHEAVLQAIVIGKTDKRRGELIKAFVVLAPEYKGKITEEELLEWCADKMATYKKPREIEFKDELPMTATGKLLRRVLKEEEEKKNV